MSVADAEEALSALNYIDPKALSQDEWLKATMAAKAAGVAQDDWDAWCWGDPRRYDESENRKRWESIDPAKPGGVTAKTLFSMAKERGWRPCGSTRAATAPSTTAPTTPPRTIPERYPRLRLPDMAYIDAPSLTEAAKADPAEQLRRYMQALHSPDSSVAVVLESRPNERRPDKPSPQGSGEPFRVGDLIDHPERALEKADEEAGAWVTVNEVDPEGFRERGRKADVAASYRYALLEADEAEDGRPLAYEEQVRMAGRLALPAVAAVWSGAKSLHLVCRVDADGPEQYRQRVEYLMGVCRANGFDVDAANKDPLRLTRLPGAMRRGQRQALVWANPQGRTFGDWERFVGEHAAEEEPEGERVRRAREALNIHRAYDYTGERTPPPPPVLIEGLMYVGRKALITGPAKSHKSMEAIHLALALATGGEWWGHRCKRSKVLYVNVEIESSEFENRVEAVRKSMGIMPEDYLDTLEFSHIKGKNSPDENEAFVVDSLCSTLEDAYRPGDYDALIIDPIYKVNPGEEDHANVAALLGRLDRHGVIMNCSIVYVHHTAKGGGAGKSIYEQGRGSGDWGGDADLMVAITELGQLREGTTGWERAQALGIADPTDCAYQIQFGTRSFRDPPRVRAFKTWPLFTRDETGALGGLLQRGDPRAKGGEVTGAKAQDRRRRRDEAVTAAVKMCGVDGVKPTKENVYERLSIDGEDRPSPESFKKWTSGAGGLTHWRNRQDEDGEWVLSECYRASDGRALYKDSKPQFLPDETGDQRGSDG